MPNLDGATIERNKKLIIKMPNHSPINVTQAVQDFRSARQKATLREIMARFTGGSTELLSFDEVRQKLKAQVSPKKVLKEIPKARIVSYMYPIKSLRHKEKLIKGKNFVFIYS